MRFIQVGVGGFGRGWLGHVARDSAAELVALVDTSEDALESARQETGLPQDRCYADYRTAFEQVDADAVLCVTPPAVHHEVALAAFERGLHVLTEKPLADTMTQGRQMVDAAQAAGKTLMVSQNYRFRSWVRTMRHLLASGEFGEPDSAFVRFAKAPRFEGSFRLKMEHPLVRDMSIHHFDLMRAVLGKNPVSVYATTWKPRWSWFDHDPCAAAIFEFEGGLQVIYHGSWVARGVETTWDGYWCVECSEAAVELRGTQVHVVLAEHPDEDTEVELHTMPCEGQALVLRQFQEAIARGLPPETSGRDNLLSMAMVFAATESAARRAPVLIEEILDSGQGNDA